MHRSFHKAYSALDELSSFVDECARTYRIPPPDVFSIRLAVEELFTNMVKYNRKHRDDVEVRFERTGDELQVTLTDADSGAFDPTQHPEPNPALRLDERRPGGLGLHLVRRMMDDVRYEHRDGLSITTLVKKLSTSHA